MTESFTRKRFKRRSQSLTDLLQSTRNDAKEPVRERTDKADEIGYSDAQLRSRTAADTNAARIASLK